MPETYKLGTNNKAILILHGFGGDVMRDTDFLIKYFIRKDYTIVRPLLYKYNDHSLYHIEKWLKIANDCVDKLSKNHEKVFILGASFGGDLAISLARNNQNVTGISTLETPIFFTTKISFLLSFFLPILKLLKIDKVRKNKFWYRKNYHQKNRISSDPFPFIPIKTISKIYKFIKKEIRQNLREIHIPFLIVQATKSDIIAKKTAKYIYNKISSRDKEIYYIETNNHDLNVLDEPQKILILEKIFKFFDVL